MHQKYENRTKIETRTIQLFFMRQKRKGLIKEKNLQSVILKQVENGNNYDNPNWGIGLQSI